MIKVFLVEDEIVIREGLRRIIPWSEYGFELSGEAGDGEMALPMIRKIKPDVIITDIKMPFMNGIALSSLIKKEMPMTKIIIISGFDDFKYAQQAISIGIERYILKPITKNNFIEVLVDIRKKYEKENEQRMYYEKFQREIQEYELHSMRDLFESLVSECCDMDKIYEKAEKLQIDISAECYNVILFSVNAVKNQVISDSYSQDTEEIQKHAELLFHNQPNYILFRNQLFSYAVLIKGEESLISAFTDECVHNLKELFSKGGKQIDWFICTGKIVKQLSSLPESYKEAMNAFAYRYINSGRVLTYNGADKAYGIEAEEMNLSNIDTSSFGQEIISNFLSNALKDEVDNFVNNYFEMIGNEALLSNMFRQYIVLNVHFCTVSFIQKLGFKKEKLNDNLNVISSGMSDTIEKTSEMVKNILLKGIQLRDESSQSRYKSILEQAVEYLNDNFTDETLTLSKVARAVNVSANHFSAIFSQEMKQTFIEYLTELRMKKAKEMLRCTDKRSGEIAMEVGYKDSHYFSFLFKKTQGCTPSDYRSKKENHHEAK